MSELYELRAWLLGMHSPVIQDTLVYFPIAVLLVFL